MVYSVAATCSTLYMIHRTTLGTELASLSHFSCPSFCATQTQNPCFPSAGKFPGSSGSSPLLPVSQDLWPRTTAPTKSTASYSASCRPCLCQIVSSTFHFPLKSFQDSLMSSLKWNASPWLDRGAHILLSLHPPTCSALWSQRLTRHVTALPACPPPRLLAASSSESTSHSSIQSSWNLPRWVSAPAAGCAVRAKPSLSSALTPRHWWLLRQYLSIVHRWWTTSCTTSYKAVAETMGAFP